MASEVLKAWADERGLAMAKHVFAKRGGHAEVHMSLEELSAVLAFAVTNGAEKATEMMAAEMVRLASTPASRASK